MTLDGLGDSRLFLVGNYATLYLDHLNLVNGRTPETDTHCNYDEPELCRGGAIAVLDHGTLIVTHCDIRGQGQGFKNARDGGGVYSRGYLTTLSFYDVTFEKLCASVGAAVQTGPGELIIVDSLTTFTSCRFIGNYGIDGTVIFAGTSAQKVYLYDCVSENNEGLTLASAQTESGRLMVGIYRCTFRNNTHLSTTSVAGAYYGAGVVAASDGGGMEIIDSLFEGNQGMPDGRGGAVGAYQSSTMTLRNCTFIENVCTRAGAVTAKASSSMIIIACFFRGNTATVAGGHFYFEDQADVVIINSTFTDSAATYGYVGYFKDVTARVENSVFRNATSGTWCAFGIAGSRVLMTDCIMHDFDFEVNGALIDASEYCAPPR